MRLLNVAEFELAAKERLTELAYDYYVGGANDEVTVRENRRAFEEIALRYRVLVDVSRRELGTTVLGTTISMPVLVAPTAFQRMACDDGELATRRATAAAGTVMILSTSATCSIADVSNAAAAPLWFQLYVYKDREVTRELVREAEAAGCSALVLTVDAPVLGRRERDVRNEFRLPDGVRLANGPPAATAQMQRRVGESGLAAHFGTIHDPSFTWRDLEWLRAVTRLPLVLKGIVRGDDGVRAVDHGVDGIIVSNHGGRQLDGSMATIRALPEVAEAVAGRAELMVDGGVRRGTDVIKALALGARAVLIGRPVIWGLAVGAESGVRQVLSILRDEIDLALALCGCPTVRDVTRDLVSVR